MREGTPARGPISADALRQEHAWHVKQQQGQCGRSGVGTEKAAGNEVRSKKEAGNCITRGLVGNCKYLNFYSEWNREPLEVFKQGSNMIKFVFQKVPPDSYVEKRWEAAGSEGWA